MNEMYGDYWRTNEKGNWTWHGRSGWSSTVFKGTKGYGAALNHPELKGPPWLRLPDGCTAEMAKRAVYEALGRLGYGQEKEGGKRETPQSGNGDRLLKILVAQMDDLELKRMRSRNHPDTARGEHDTDLYQIAVEEVDRRRRSA